MRKRLLQLGLGATCTLPHFDRYFLRVARLEAAHCGRSQAQKPTLRSLFGGSKASNVAVSFRVGDSSIQRRGFGSVVRMARERGEALP